MKWQTSQHIINVNYFLFDKSMNGHDETMLTINFHQLRYRYSKFAIFRVNWTWTKLPDLIDSNIVDNPASRYFNSTPRVPIPADWKVQIVQYQTNHLAGNEGVL